MEVIDMPDATRAELVLAPSPAESARMAALAFLAGYTTRTRESYALDLRRWLAFCETNGVEPFQARRPHIELFARHMESEGLAIASVARRLSTVCVWYGYLEAEDWIPKNPAT